MPKLWIDDKMYSVESEVQDYCDKLAERIEKLETEIQEVSNQLYDLYELCSDTTRPKIYGTILGLHERLNHALKGD